MGKERKEREVEGRKGSECEEMSERGLRKDLKATEDTVPMRKEGKREESGKTRM